MNRRKFAFWLGMAMFWFARRSRADSVDRLAAKIMRVTESKPKRSVAKKTASVQWLRAEDDNYRWFERRTQKDGKWRSTGRTCPKHKETFLPKKRKSSDEQFLSDNLVPPKIRFRDLKPSEERRDRHGRPPSKWLRSLNAAELRVWMKTITVPEAGVEGMTFLTHLTRDHMFDAKRIKGLTESEQAKLHAAAHHGY